MASTLAAIASWTRRNDVVLRVRAIEPQGNEVVAVELFRWFATISTGRIAFFQNSVPLYFGQRTFDAVLLSVAHLTLSHFALGMRFAVLCEANALRFSKYGVFALLAHYSVRRFAV